jgi:hypothetical protein
MAISKVTSKTTQEWASPSDLGQVVVSAVAQSSGSMLKQTQLLTELQNKLYEMQMKRIQTQKDVAIKLGEITQKEGEKEADSTRYNAWGSIASGGISGVLSGIAAKSYFNSRSELKPKLEELDTVAKNQRILSDESLKPKTGQSVAEGDSTIKPVEEAQKALRQDIIANRKMKEENAAAVFEDKAAGESIKKEVEDRQNKLGEEIRIAEQNLNSKSQMLNQMGSSLGSVASGVGGTEAAGSKEQAAKAAKDKTLDQSTQTMLQSVLDNGHKVIGSFDSAKEAIARIHAEISASNRV